jgi:SAM-dependent methyltransferase
MPGKWIDGFVRSAANLRPHRRVRLPSGVVKVNVGSGIEVADGWVNLDGSLHALLSNAPRSVLSLVYRHTKTVSQLRTEAAYIKCLKQHTFVFHNIEHGLPFDENTVDYLYSSHVLEHLDAATAKALVRDMFRVLKPGGRARICVPDLAKAVGLYLEGARHEALEYFFSDGRVGSYDQHRYMYDFELLAETLVDAGFVEVTKCRYREGAVPDLEQLDNRPEQTLYVEATKLSN